MANKSILDVDVNASSGNDDAFFINSNQSLKQIKKNNIRNVEYLEKMIQSTQSSIANLLSLMPLEIQAAMIRISEEEYAKLVLLGETTYSEPVVIPA